MGRPRGSGAPAPLEKAIQAAVIAHWRALGLPGSLVAAIPNANAHGQPGLHKGLFDLIVISPGFGVRFIELKTESGKLSAAQEDFRHTLIRCDVPYAVTHGRDEPIKVLEDWGAVRKQRAAA